MAHMIETIAYAGETPWHGLGKRVPNNLSPYEMLNEAGINWNVVKKPLYYADVDGSPVIAKNKQALVRETDGKLLDVVGDGWHPTQNYDAFEFFNDFCASSQMTMETAGSLKEGRWVWGLARLNDGFELKGGDQVNGYLLFSNPHIWGMSTTVQLTPIRVVCNNTITMALNGFSASGIYRQGHAKVFDTKAADATIGLARAKFDTFKEQATILRTKQFNQEQLNAYFAEIFPSNDQEKTSRRFDNAMEALETQPGAEMGAGTFWQAFNTVTYLVDHRMGRSQDNRLSSAWYGQGKNLKLKALDVALKMAA
jgi:phage/plasmid-like protein (TIGR03299 family)